jgi:hypothetical protein
LRRASTARARHDEPVVFRGIDRGVKTVPLRSATVAGSTARTETIAVRSRRRRNPTSVGTGCHTGVADPAADAFGRTTRSAAADLDGGSPEPRLVAARQARATARTARMHHAIAKDRAAPRGAIELLSPQLLGADLRGASTSRSRAAGDSRDPGSRGWR